MKITKFTGEGLHDFLDIEIDFREDLTFLVGINGSGKTTALEAINSMFVPQFSALSKTKYKMMKVEFNFDGVIGYIKSTKNENIIKLETSSSEQSIEFPAYVIDPEVPSYKEIDHEQEYYRDIVSRHAQNDVLLFINSLPTPMFLGLNRRGNAPTARTQFGSSWERGGRSRRNIFSGSLAQGVSEAIHLAETQHRDTLIEVGRLGEKLRHDMLLELLTVEPREHLGKLSPPTDAELKRIPVMRRGMDELANILGLPRSEVRQKIGTFLDALEKASKQIPKGASLQKVIEGKSEDESRAIIDAIINWSSNSPGLNRINRLSEMVEAYNKNVKILTERADRYLHLLSQFLTDSKKEISFDDRGYISINLLRNDGRTVLSSFSSGESQIFVILTHLLFNPRAVSGNVFIIDEPELSLHVQWQELFVDSVLTANPYVQYVMATHSPSIILDRVDCCVDVVAKERPLGKFDHDS